jgi:hypothetical protein
MADTNTLSAPQASTIYLRNATTEWGLLPAPGTNHWYIISLNDKRRLRDDSGSLDLVPLGTTNSSVDWWFNGPNDASYYYLDNLTRLQSIQSKGTAPAFSFSMINVSAPSSATQWRLVLPYQPVAIATPVPLSVSMNYTNGSATLTWAGSGSFYNVYRAVKSGGPYTKIASTITTTNYLDSNLQNGTAYYYVITALDILGVESSNSIEVVGRPASTIQPSMSFGPGSGGLQLNWPSDHTGWRLRMKTNDLNISGGWTTISSSASTNAMTVPLTLWERNVFFQLVYP